MDTEKQINHWQEIYHFSTIERLPWFYPNLDPDLRNALNNLNIRSGSALDLGTGPGTQAIALAKEGFAVTGVDISQLALDKAMLRAKDDGVTIDFRYDDIFHSKIDQDFDFVLDRGCFHGVPPEHRPDYVRQVQRLVRSQGYIFLKCFSHLEPGTRGPFRFTPQQIRSLFSEYFDIKSIDETVYHGMRQPLPLALFCVLSKKAGVVQI